MPPIGQRLAGLAQEHVISGGTVHDGWVKLGGLFVEQALPASVADLVAKRLSAAENARRS
jgi:hypothetical protein